jgi:uncharacterized protein YndB with AHSA1/START domain
MIRFLPLPLLMLATAPAPALVTAATDNAFVVEHKLAIAAPPARVWDTLVHIGGWWEDAHSYSGDSANMTLDPRPGGCWCEKVGNGGVEHMRVIYADPGSTLRLAGGLGPLQAMPVNGVLTIAIKPAGAGSEVAVTYGVSGYMPGGLGAIAPQVDEVLGAQWAALKRAAEAK